MPYNSIISRTNADSTIPIEIANSIISDIPQQSAVLPLMTQLPAMSAKQFKMPVLDVLPVAYFVSPGASDDTLQKQTTNMEWTDVSIYAEELAVIVPIPESVIADSGYDIWGEVRPRIAAAFAKAIDAAILYGTNRPSTWPVGIHPLAVAASQTVTTAGVAGEDLYDEIFGDGNLLALVEADGYIPSAHLAAISMRGKLRGTRDSIGNPIFRPMGSSGTYELGDGVPITFPTNGAFAPATTLMITGDWKKAVWAPRQDMTIKVFDTGVVQDQTGAIVYNLLQQDMVALRATMRLGWQVPNPVNAIQSTAASRCPWACLLP